MAPQITDLFLAKQQTNKQTNSIIG